MGGNISFTNRFWLSAGIVLVLDQLSKWAAQKGVLEYGVSSEIKLHYTINRGAGFGILQNQKVLLIIISVLVALGILAYFSRFSQNIHVPVALIFGGTLGNLLDRVLFGYVRDFIGIWIWPSFNIADMAITIGVIWIVGEEMMMNGKKRPQKK